MYCNPITSKSPGDAGDHRENYLKDLGPLSVGELKMLIERQANLLNNKKQLQNLPDKGAKIKTLHDRLQNELANKFSVDQAAALLEGLNIAAVGKKAMNDIEWNGTYRKTETVVLDSDDDEEPEDPLKIIACSTTVSKSKIIKVEKEIPLITEKDLEEIKSFRDEHVQTPSENDTSSLLEPHAVHMCAFDKFLEPNNRKKFLPHQTTISNVHAPEKEKVRDLKLQACLGKHWENTSATPPPLKNCGVKMLSLQESIEAENVQREKTKIIAMQQAEERLVQKALRQECSGIPTKINESNSKLDFSNYRDFLEEDNFEGYLSENEEVDDD